MKLETIMDAIECLICYKQYRLLGPHVVQKHHMLMLEYKIMFGLDRTRRNRHLSWYIKTKSTSTIQKKTA